MLPESWHRNTLGHCGELLTGFAFPSQAYADTATHSIRLLRGDNVMQGALAWEGAKHWSAPYDKQLTRYEMRAGDIVIAMDRPVTNAGLKCSIVQPQDLPCLLVQRVARIRAKDDFDQGYLAQMLQTNSFIQHIKSQKTETAVPHISPNDILDFAIAVPESMDEQQRIARILATWDQSIVTVTRLLTNSLNRRLGLLAATLHSAPATGGQSAKTDNGGFPSSVQPGIPTLAPTPTGWRRIHLGEHLREIRRPVALIDDQLYTLVTVKRSRGGVEQREVLRGSEVKTPSQFFVRAGDFLISKRQIVHGACGIVPPELDGAVVSNEYAVFNTDGEIDLKFLRYLSESRYFQQTCFHSSIGVHVEKMIFKTERWLKWPFNIPPLAQQRRIVEILDAAGMEVDLIARQLAVLKKEKSALMAQLLTGKRRVRLPEAVEAMP